MSDRRRFALCIALAVALAALGGLVCSMSAIGDRGVTSHTTPAGLRMWTGYRDSEPHRTHALAAVFLWVSAVVVSGVGLALRHGARRGSVKG
jgi:hypothetical protein